MSEDRPIGEMPPLSPPLDLAAVVRQFFTYLDTTEESDSGREFHPVHLSCCRAAWVKDLNRVIADMKRLSVESHS